MRTPTALLALLLAAPPAFAKAPTWLNGGEDPWIELEREAAAYKAQQPAPPPAAQAPEAPPPVDDSPPAPARPRITELPPDDPFYEPFEDPMTAPLADPMGGALADGQVTATEDDRDDDLGDDLDDDFEPAPAVEACPMVQRPDLARAIGEEQAKLAAAAAALEAQVDDFAAEAEAI
ncbi:MAG: hypothetical protein KC613_08785, partial [Myxococcales bacterium]|nr:hypothetical protein [Myxococcales bacterium]